MGRWWRISGLACCGVGALLLCGTWACESTASTRRELGSANPLDRARAAVRVAEQGDVTAIHRLVDLLEDPNDGVRLYAILALERLTGETRGYRYYANAVERAAAVRRWRDALRAGEVVIRNQAAGQQGTSRGNTESASAGTASANREAGP